MPTNYERQYTRTECVVAVIDVLDQRNQIKLISDAQNEDQHAEAFAQTINRRDYVRNVATSALAESHTPASVEKTKHLDPNLRPMYDTYFDHVQLGCYSFSDTTALYLRLDRKDDATRLSEELELLATSCFLTSLGIVILDCLSNRIAIRGAFATGRCYVATDNAEIYGPAFLQAYDLEQTCAAYPRIIAAPEFISRLRRLSEQENIIGKRAAQCHALLHQDDDGFYTIDFLNVHFQSLAADFREKAKRAKQFALEEFQRFDAAQDTKLAPRYFRLAKYIRGYLPDSLK